MKTIKFLLFFVTSLLLTFSSALHSTTFWVETYVGVINVHLPSSRTNAYQATQGEYKLHTTRSNPLKLIFAQGRPKVPVMTGDKVKVIGLNIEDELYVQQLVALPGQALPF